MITKVTIKGAKQAVQMFGPAQAAVAKAVADSVESGVIPKDQAEDLVIVCGVFIHWLAEDDKKIYDNNYQATLDSISNAIQGKPSVDEMIQRRMPCTPSEDSKLRQRILKTTVFGIQNSADVTCMDMPSLFYEENSFTT